MASSMIEAHFPDKKKRAGYNPTLRSQSVRIRDLQSQLVFDYDSTRAGVVASVSVADRTFDRAAR